MPGMAKTFTQGGTVAKPVVVLFEGEWTGFGAGVTVDVQLTIDGVVHSRPALVQSRNSAELSRLGTHGFNFVRQRSLIVLHK
jgi:hypothetical protein